MKLRREGMSDVGMYITLLILTLIVAYFSLGAGLDFNIYASVSGGDTVFSLESIKSIQENGILGIFVNPRIGAPESSALIDYPGMDIGMALIIWFISCFTSSTTGIMYIYYIITFPCNAIAMLLLLRKLKINRSASFVISAIFSFVPYHFLRGLGHFTLINYSMFVVALYLALCILGYFENERFWKIICMAILLGIGYGYYYAFGLIIMAIAVVIRFFRDPNLKKCLSYIWIPIVTLITVICTLLPKIIFSIVNGANTIAGIRYPIEQEYFGLKIIQLLLPPSYTRVSKFSDIYNTYVSQAPLITENVTASLGIVAGIGFIVLCVLLIYSFVMKEKCKSKDWVLIDFLSLSTLSILLMGTIGGFGEIFNWAITSQIRCYNRGSIFIAGLSLIMVAILLNKIHLKRKWLTLGISVAILGISMYDTVPVKNADWQEQIQPVQENYEKFFNTVENTFNSGDMIYQLPYLDFPEVSNTFDYKHFIGYLFTDTLRWSYGGVKGRNIKAKELFVDEGKSYLFLKKIKDAGFSAVYIDLSGFDDNGESILEFYNSLGIESITSDDGILYVYDIRSLDIKDEQCQAGYIFIENLNDIFNMELSTDNIKKFAEKLGEKEDDSERSLYKLLEEKSNIKKYPEKEYIEYLYSDILGRKATEEEIVGWEHKLQGEMTREDIFVSFLNGIEFREKQGYE